MLTKSAEKVWQSLHGIICVYKPPNTTWKYISSRIKHNICKELNTLETRPPRNCIELNYNEKAIEVNVRPSYADHILCVGPRYQPQDVRFHFPSYLGEISSGVFVLGLNKGYTLSKLFKHLGFTKCFQLKGILGLASSNFISTSRPIARGKYEHVDLYMLNKILASYQAANQRKIFEHYGVKLDSQEAYDLAVSGLYRPHEKGSPIIYDLKCIEFSPPNFTIEIQCINENETFLMGLIHNLGINLKSLASCTGIRCIRHGCFLVQHTLLKSQWTVQNIINNMEANNELLNQNYHNAIKNYDTVNVLNNNSNVDKKNELINCHEV